mgnify:CR=1 FL=1
MLRITAAISTLLLLLCSAPGSAAPSQILPEPTEELPKIAIILDDLGYNRHAGEQALQLPGNLTYAIIPFTPYSQTLAQAAHDRNREVILHLPMESSDPNRRLDEGGLTSELDEHEVKQRVKSALDSVPHIAGLNNHMGSLLTQQLQPMDWVMKELFRYPVYFIDSRTIASSVAGDVAAAYRIPTMTRDVFLDHEQTEEFVDRQFKLLIKRAKENGSAIGIGHPHKVTVDYLEKHLPKLDEQGIAIATVSGLWAMRNGNRRRLLR